MAEHEWVFVVVSSPRTAREARRFLEGERKVFRKFDLADPEVVRSAALMCAVCKLAPAEPGDLALPCRGEPVDA